MNSLNHVAIIMDGNGRWGLKNKNSRNSGHKAGLNTVEKNKNEASAKTEFEKRVLEAKRDAIEENKIPEEKNSIENKLGSIPETLQAS